MNNTPENAFLVHAWNGRNVLLTGMAGTGKSYVLREFVRGLQHGPDLFRQPTWPDGTPKPEPPGHAIGRKVDVTAPTGIAALNVSGRTVHRWSGMLLGPQDGQDDDTYFEWLCEQRFPSIRAGFARIRSAECLVIDEISMLPGRQFTFLEYLFRRLRIDSRPWGGCQIICVGDFLQLAPVRTSDAAPYDWAFATEAWQRTGFVPVVLETVRRQDERDFITALSGVREGNVRGDSAAILHGRISLFPPASIPRLFTHNVQVDRWNRAMLDELPGEEVSLPAYTMGNDNQVEFLRKNLMCPEDLRLKRGARVMFTMNDREGRFVNGSIGTVDQITPDIVTLEVGGEPVWLERYTWKSGENGNEGIFCQFPLRLAYALTIHKSQGLTLDAAYIDVRAAREPGQCYVALSRVRSLAGLHLKEWFRGLYVSDEAIAFHRNLATAPTE